MSDDKKAATATEKAKNDSKVSLNPRQLTQLYQAERKKVVTIRRRAQGVENILLETIGAKQVLEEIKMGKAEEVMLPIGAGFFMSATRQKDATLLKSMAGNVMLPVSPADGIVEAEKNEESARKQLEALQKEEQSALANLAQLENALALISQQRQMAKAKGESASEKN